MVADAALDTYGWCYYDTKIICGEASLDDWRFVFIEFRVSYWCASDELEEASIYTCELDGVHCSQ